MCCSVRSRGYRSFREKFTFRAIPSPPMVYRKISEDLKNRAIILYDQGLIPDDISKLLEISNRSLSRWRSNQETYGSVIPPLTYRSGRSRILDAEQVLSVSE